MNKRGVYFFILDAFIGSAIVLVSLMVILSSYSSTAEKESPMTILEDFMTYLQNTQVRDFNGNYTFLLLNTSNITHPDNSLFEQISELHFLNNSDVTYNFISDVVNNTLPEQMSLRYFYDNVQLFEKEVFPWVDAGLVLSSKKVAMVTINTSMIYGPHLVEVILWTS